MNLWPFCFCTTLSTFCFILLGDWNACHASKYICRIHWTFFKIKTRVFFRGINQLLVLVLFMLESSQNILLNATTNQEIPPFLKILMYMVVVNSIKKYHKSYFLSEFFRFKSKSLISFETISKERKSSNFLIDRKKSIIIFYPFIET